MDEKEYLKRLKTNKFSKKEDKLIEYRLPVLQYYLDNEFDLNINGISLKGKIQIIYKKEDFRLVNKAFLSLRKQHGYDK